MIFQIASKCNVIIDESDYNRVKQYRYYLMTRTGIVRRSIYSKKLKKTTGSKGLAHDILGISSSKVVLHRDGNKLDFRKRNLVTVKKGHRNIQAGISHANTSGYRGVSFNNRTGKYDAYIRVKYKKKSLGSYYTAIAAAIAYNEAAEKHFGPEFNSYNRL